MNPAVQKFCAWSGAVYIVTFIAALVVIGGMIPPTPPSWPAERIAAFYDDGRISIRVATALVVLAVPFGFSWTAVIAIWTARAEGKLPVMAWSQLICGLFTFGGAYLGAIFWSVGAFRPDRLPEIVILLNDLGWFWMLMPGSCAVMQCIFIGISILSDRRSEPIFPRWVGFFNIWAGILQTSTVMMSFFHTGPFAWNGIFAFWMPLTVFSSWICVDTWALLRAIKREARGEIRDYAD